MDPYTERILAEWPKPPIPLEHLEDILWLLGSERHRLAGWVLVPPEMVLQSQTALTKA